MHAIYMQNLACTAGMQVLAGDVKAAAESFAAFFGVWERFGLLPERYLYGGSGALHPTEQYYPLRPELIESAFYLSQACFTSCSQWHFNMAQTSTY